MKRGRVKRPVGWGEGLKSKRCNYKLLSLRGLSFCSILHSKKENICVDTYASSGGCLVEKTARETLLFQRTGQKIKIKQRSFSEAKNFIKEKYRVFVSF